MNECTIKQSFRMLEAGCPEVSLRMDGHKIIAEQMPLGRLWDIVHNLGLEYDRHNFLLMHAMGPNVAGVIGSAVAAGALLGFLS